MSTNTAVSRPRRAVTLSAATTSNTASGSRSSTDRPSITGSAMDLSWKDGGSLYPKRSSQIGSDFQATDIPKCGSHERGSCSDLYDQIWTPKEPETTIMNKILKDQVPQPKVEQAFLAFGELGTKLNEVDEETVSEMIQAIKPCNGSDWTDAEKKRFDMAIFRCRKDLKAVSQAMGKDLKSCLTYYLGTYKKSQDYPLTKAVCVDERHEKALSSIHGVDACAICGDGGSLLICDGCEGEYHMGCLRPPLKVIPEGHWECDECVDKKILKTREFIIMNSKLYKRCHQGDKKRKAEEVSADDDGNLLGDNMILRPSSPILNRMKIFATEVSSAFDIGGKEKGLVA